MTMATAMLKILQWYMIWLWIIQVSSLVSHDFYSYHAVRRCIFHFINEKLGFIKQWSWNDHRFHWFAWGNFLFPGQLPWMWRITSRKVNSGRDLCLEIAGGGACMWHQEHKVQQSWSWVIICRSPCGQNADVLGCNTLRADFKSTPNWTSGALS